MIARWYTQIEMDFDMQGNQQIELTVFLCSISSNYMKEFAKGICG